MKLKELVRWGVPTIAFLIYFKWGGLALSLVLWGILFAVISAFIAWHKRDPQGFFVGVRAWIIVLLIAPSALATIGMALGAPIGMVVTVPLLLLAIWLYKLNARKIESHKVR